MNEAIIIWLYLSIGNAVTGFLVIGSLVIIVMLAVTMIVNLEAGSSFANKEDKDRAAKINSIWVSKKMFLMACLFFLCAFYPSKQDLKYIIGGAVVWNGIEAAKDIEGLEKLPKNLVDAANSFLEKTVEDAKQSH